MAVERLKFRCYQCNQLLASSPAKAGSIVACPRCKADLVVPGPEANAPADPESSAVGKASGRAASSIPPPPPTGPRYLDEMAAGIPADLIDLRPEDLRVEAGFFERLTRAPAPPNEPEPAPWVMPAPPAPVQTVETALPATPALAPPAIETPAPAAPPTALRQETPNAATAPSPEPIPSRLAQPSTDVPPINIEPPSLRPPSWEPNPVREVVLPASAVIAWSLFGLIGIATSFIAGLMVGHYFWRM